MRLITESRLIRVCGPGEDESQADGAPSPNSRMMSFSISRGLLFCHPSSHAPPAARQRDARATAREGSAPMGWKGRACFARPSALPLLRVLWTTRDRLSLLATDALEWRLSDRKCRHLHFPTFLRHRQRLALASCREKGFSHLRNVRICNAGKEVRLRRHFQAMCNKISSLFSTVFSTWLVWKIYAPHCNNIFHRNFLF
jgi:hypothetical protein